MHDLLAMHRRDTQQQLLDDAPDLLLRQSVFVVSDISLQVAVVVLEDEGELFVAHVVLNIKKSG